jgi:anti-sigma regulatory factor (Ser/Thr protein kinase)
MEASASLAAEPRSVPAARRLLRRLLEAAGVHGEASANALLVTSELVDNAIEHGARPGDEIEVDFAVRRDRVQIRVRDPMRGRSAPIALTPDHHRAAGRGLQLVEQLAIWDDRVVHGQREVRAELLI